MISDVRVRLAAMERKVMVFGAAGGAEVVLPRSYCHDLKRRRNSEVSRANKAQRLLVDTTVETAMSALQAKVDAGSPLERPQLFDAQLEALRSAGAAAEVMKQEAAEAKAAAEVER